MASTSSIFTNCKVPEYLAVFASRTLMPATCDPCDAIRISLGRAMSCIRRNRASETRRHAEKDVSRTQAASCLLLMTRCQTTARTMSLVTGAEDFDGRSMRQPVRHRLESPKWLPRRDGIMIRRILRRLAISWFFFPVLGFLRNNFAYRGRFDGLWGVHRNGLQRTTRESFPRL